MDDDTESEDSSKRWARTVWRDETTVRDSATREDQGAAIVEEKLERRDERDLLCTTGGLGGKDDEKEDEAGAGAGGGEGEGTLVPDEVVVGLPGMADREDGEETETTSARSEKTRGDEDDELEPFDFFLLLPSMKSR